MEMLSIWHPQTIIVPITIKIIVNTNNGFYFKLCQVVRLSGGAGPKRGTDDEIPDTTPKHDDPPLITNILTGNLPDFEQFIMALPQDRKIRLYEFTLAQKQGDRVLAAFLNEVPAKNQLQEKL